MKNVLRLFMILCIALAGTAVFAQDIATKGSIGGIVTDTNGAAVPNAKVTITGQQGEVTAQTNDQGSFRVTDLIPGTYTVTVEQQGFKKQVSTGVTVNVGRESTVSPKLEIGNISEVVTVTDTGGIDQQSTAVGQSLNDDLFNQIPVPRGVVGLFYLSPGASDSLGGGAANPSIAGGSALDNLYIADGVNITDSAFGGLGTFTRVYGSLGTGINTSFIKEVQIKTGGFEPQYGQSQGGIVNIITQSGGNEYHGAVYGFMRPDAFEAKRKQRDDFSVNKVGKILAEEQFDAGVDIGGYVPGARDNLFFFGSFNPTVRKQIVLGAEGSGLLTQLGEHNRRYRTYNYAFKTDYQVNSNHAFAFSIFGDPTRTNKTSFNTLNVDNTSAQSAFVFGTRNMALRYNGTLTPTWTLNSSWSWGKNTFDETGFDDIYNVVDLTQTGGLPGQRGQYRMQGLGFFEPTQSNTYRFNIDSGKTFGFLGQHNVSVGYQYQRAYYSGVRDRSGPKSPLPATNATGQATTTLLPAAAAGAVGQPTNNAWTLRLVPDALQDGDAANGECTLCPFFNVPGIGDTRVYLLNDRGEYGGAAFTTRANYHAAYFQDTWRINKYVTALLGIRNEQERLIGNPGATGESLAYSFTGNWAPRIGVTVDPLGQGKTKAYYNYGRFFEYIPLDLAERSLSSEQSFRNAEFIPDFTMVAGVPRVRLNSLGSAEPIFDAAHFVSCGTGTAGAACRAAGGFGSTVSISLNDPHNVILPGTKLGFAREHILGFEHQFPSNVVFSVRYQDRRLKRIVEDAAVVAPEAANFFGQAYFIGNVNSQLDAATNPISVIFTPAFDAAGDLINLPAACHPDLVNTDVGVCYQALGANGQPAGEGIPDGVADGFPDPVHIYKALEIEVNKRFSNNWQLLSNVRFASLRGNFEGHFRNDNGQTDPAISSLFDFTEGEFNLLGDQTAVGPLNTDRTTVFNIYANYVFSKDSGFGRSLAGLNLGFGLHGESGVPINEFLAHPVYNNQGEVPVGGRGSLGRTNWFTRLDLHADYRWNLSEKTRLVFIGDFFNVTNSQGVRLPNQFRELSVGTNNVDFLQPLLFHPAFNMRLGMRFEF